MLHRPLVARTEWTGCGNRNPDLAAYSELMGAIRDRFFVVSVADLEDKREWLVGEACSPDVALHHGELVFEVLGEFIKRLKKLPAKGSAQAHSRPAVRSSERDRKSVV